MTLYYCTEPTCQKIASAAAVGEIGGAIVGTNVNINGRVLTKSI